MGFSTTEILIPVALAYIGVILIWSTTPLAIKWSVKVRAFCSVSPGGGTVALVTLITPVLALLLGHALNAEPVELSIWVGAGLISAGLIIHQWGERLPPLRHRSRVRARIHQHLLVLASPIGRRPARGRRKNADLGARW